MKNRQNICKNWKEKKLKYNKNMLIYLRYKCGECGPKDL